MLRGIVTNLFSVLFVFLLQQRLLLHAAVEFNQGGLFLAEGDEIQGLEQVQVDIFILLTLIGLGVVVDDEGGDIGCDALGIGFTDKPFRFGEQVVRLLVVFIQTGEHA